ncbi:MAG: DUF402 domain-containing protein [Lachnospiraceae bacterium]|nr:DUF402 domain-containing protein [Lachnospiraceae bacterium]
MDKDIHLYRKRLIPDECLPLNSDKIIHSDDEIIVTEWDPIHPRKDIKHGFSCFFLKKNYKVSLFMGPDGKPVYWYCDIVDLTIENNDYTFRDLLADVVVYPDKTIKVLDLDELGEALIKGLLDKEDVAKALSTVNELLNIIYSGDFSTLTKEITDRI